MVYRVVIAFGEQMSYDGHSLGRRSFGRWLSAMGLAGLAPTTFETVVDRRDRRAEQRAASLPEKHPMSGDPTAPVYHSHVLETTRTRRRLEGTMRDHLAIVGPRLSAVTHPTAASAKFDVLVKTVGEPHTITSSGPYGRQIHGWRPTPEEVALLASVGDVGYVPRFSTTAISVSGVESRHISRLARDPRVLSIDAFEPVGVVTGSGGDGIFGANAASGGNARSGGDVASGRSTGRSSWATDHAENTAAVGGQRPMETRAALGFDDGAYCIPRGLKIGICDSGYSTDQESPFHSYPGAETGFDEPLADRFDDTWDRADDEFTNAHGNVVTDSLAALLGPDNVHGDDSLVPLRIQEGGTWKTRLQAAIEFAEEHDIAVLNMSLSMNNSDGSDATYEACPSYFCDYLRAYTEAGYVPVASSGNNGTTDAATAPGCEWFTIGVGAARETTTGFERRSYSDYGTITYRDGQSVHCPHCQSMVRPHRTHWAGFAPDVYAPGRVRTRTTMTPRGTSISTAVVSAAVAILQSHGVFDYARIKRLLRRHSAGPVNPPAATRSGGFLDLDSLLAEVSWNAG